MEMKEQQLQGGTAQTPSASVSRSLATNISRGYCSVRRGVITGVRRRQYGVETNHGNGIPKVPCVVCDSRDSKNGVQIGSESYHSDGTLEALGFLLIWDCK